MADKIKVWFAAEADFLEVRFSDAAGHMTEINHDAVMERLDAQGQVIGLSIMGVSKFRGGFSFPRLESPPEVSVGDRLRSGVGCGRCERVFSGNRPSRGCASHPRGVCTGPPDHPGSPRAADASCRPRSPTAIEFYVRRSHQSRRPLQQVARRLCRLLRLGRA